MTKVFYAIGDFFEALFPFFNVIGRFTNIIFIILGSLATVIWLNHMKKLREERKSKGVL